jgi:hypothetical protein
VHEDDSETIWGDSLKAYSIDEDDVWVDYQVKVRDSMIELRERRGGELVFLLLFTTVLPIGMAISFYQAYGYFGWFQAVICLVAAGLAGWASVNIYRAPRSLRIFPLSRKIVVSRCMFALRYRAQTYDLSKAQVKARVVAYQAYEPYVEPEHPEQQRSGGQFMGLLWSLIDFIGPFVQFMRTANTPKISKVGYALVIDQPCVQVIAVFQTEADAHDLLNAIGLTALEEQAEL